MKDGNLVSLEEGRKLWANSAKRAGKYNAHRTELDGHKFASRKEATHYLLLKEQKRSGKISGFGLQSRYPLVVNGLQIATYVSDFDVYHFNGKKEVVDCKGYRAKNSLPYRIFLIKKALMKALYGIEVREI